MVMSRWDRMKTPVFVAVGGLAASAYVYANDPSEPGHFPPCPTKVLSGLDCPFCGGLRSTHELMHGNLSGALDYNAFTVLLAIPAMLVVFGIWSWDQWRGEDEPRKVPVWTNVSVALLLVVFTVVRNLPGMPLGTSA